jgi:hypothetical protein
VKIRAIPEASPLRQRGRTSDWMVRAGYKETDMSKNNDTSKLGPAMQVRELRDDELEKVSGGLGAANDVSHLSRHNFVSGAIWNPGQSDDINEVTLARR